MENSQEQYNINKIVSPEISQTYLWVVDRTASYFSLCRAFYWADVLEYMELPHDTYCLTIKEHYRNQNSSLVCRLLYIDLNEFFIVVQ